MGIKKNPLYRNRALLFAIKMCIAVILIAWLIAGRKIDFSLLFSVKNHFLEYSIGFGFLCAGWLVQVYRWKKIVFSYGIVLSFKDACQMTMASHFSSQFLPGIVGGDIVRGYFIADRNPMQRLLAISTIVLDRGLGLYASLLLGIVSSFMFYMGGEEAASRDVLAIGILLCILLGGVHFMWQIGYSRRTFGFLNKVLSSNYLKKYTDAAMTHKFSSKELRFGIGLSVISSIFSILAFAMIGRAISPEAGWLEFFIVCPLVFISLALPVSPGGIGVGETAAAFLFAAFGISSGAMIMVMYRLMNICLKLPGVYFLVSYRKKR